MRVTCPECESKFKVPDKALGTTGRKLRCSQCAHEWFQEPAKAKPERREPPVAKKEANAKGKPKGKPKPKVKPEPLPEPEPPDELPEDETLDEGETGLGGLRARLDDDPPPLGGVSRFRGPRSPARSDRRLPVALLVLTAAAVAVPAILFAARGSLVEAWPASALLYDTVGLHVEVPGEGLILQNVYVQRQQEGSVPLLLVAGEIRNPTENLRSLPTLRGTVLDDQGAALQSWLFTAEVTQLLPGDVVRFQSELPAPEGLASRVNVTFTNERPAAGLGY